MKHKIEEQNALYYRTIICFDKWKVNNWKSNLVYEIDFPYNGMYGLSCNISDELGRDYGHSSALPFRCLIIFVS